MSILVGFILLGVGIAFGYILCAILSFDRNYIDEFKLTATNSVKKRPNYLITYGDNKMIEMHYNKDLSWIQIKVLKWLFGVDVKKLVYDVEEEDANNEKM